MVLTTSVKLATLMAIILPYASADISFNSTGVLSGYKDPYWNGIVLPSAPISSTCAATWARTLPCSDWFLKLKGSRLGGDYKQDVFDQRCADECISALRDWRDDLRADCTTEDVTSVNSADDSAWNGSKGGQAGLSMFLNDTALTVETWFYDTCLKDLNSGTYCYLLPKSDPFAQAIYLYGETDPNSRTAAVFCDSTCSTQLSIFALEVASTTTSLRWDISKSLMNARTLCPDLDTSKYPFFGSGSTTSGSGSTATTSGSGSSSSTGSSSSQTSSSAESLDQTSSTSQDENAALSLKVVSSVWVFGSAIIAIFIGFGCL